MTPNGAFVWQGNLNSDYIAIISTASNSVVADLPVSGAVYNLAIGPMIGDLNGDGVVNCADLAIVKASFGKRVGQAGFDFRADANGDGIVNVLDLSFVAKRIPAGTVCQ